MTWTELMRTPKSDIESAIRRRKQQEAAIEAANRRFNMTEVAADDLEEK